MEYKSNVKNVLFKEECWCENCGHLEPYTAVTDVEDNYYCINCDDDLVLTDEERGIVKVTEVQKKIAYFKRRINDLESFVDFEKLVNDNG